MLTAYRYSQNKYYQKKYSQNKYKQIIKYCQKLFF